ncbi:inovirus Gp2 family protein [Arcobacter cryaerophilus gv. pseudocryaerophilus]|uniref:inovirus Gp2 family protein n=1 Tax=Aliarcobacter cryaerophilus TaxID=28198 RepID=UPI0021B53E9B|nr:inovirus Gp2 family protein [Aliarcobacter cryaerophilus]MCT7482127.1 inovirus Gp2 family protein [Aliarcobacter cryaerophilus]
MAFTKDKRRRISNENYLDALQDKYSKLCVVRVDLEYAKNSETNKVEITLNEANKHINRLLNNRRNNEIFDHNIGYLIKTEYGEDRNVHFHSFFFYNGQKVKKDMIKAENIGKYWSENITQGQGTYYSCNRNDYKDKHAIGMLDYRDAKKRRNLDYAMAYLVKEDQCIEALKENKKDRIIRRGTLPKEKSNFGRPRNK